MTSFPSERPCCLSRRTFLADFGLGFTGLALGAMLAQDGIVKASEPEAPSPQRVGKPKLVSDPLNDRNRCAAA